MAPPEVFNLSQQSPVTCHAFNGDRTQVAVSLNSHEVRIYARQGNDWNHIDTLTEHDKPVTSIDWAPRSNRIVTSAQDRNAYVWQQTPDPLTGQVIWKPTLVLLRINRAATYVRWSPNEDKFACASGARAIAVCSFDSESDWWVARHLKKPIRSTILSIDWHPNNVLLAAGGADMKARVFSAYIKDLDKRPAPSVWGEKFPFNTLCGEWSSPAGGWVHGVAFSPSGDALAFASHDSSVTVIYPGAPAAFAIRLSILPLVTLAWTTEESLVAAGHDCQPLVFAGNQGGWELVGSLDDPQANKTSGGARSGFGGASPVGRLNSSAFNTFRNAAERGISNVPGSPTASSATESELFTVHQNTINSVRPYDGGAGSITRVSTSAVDGKLVVWDVNAITPVGSAGLTGKMSKLSVR